MSERLPSDIEQEYWRIERLGVAEFGALAWFKAAFECESAAEDLMTDQGPGDDESELEPDPQ